MLLSYSKKNNLKKRLSRITTGKTLPSSTGKTAMRDSINTKVFGEEGVGLGEGKETLSEERVSFPSPIHLNPPSP